MIKRTALFFALVAGSSPVLGADILVLVMQSGDGKRGAHHQTVTHENCVKFLDLVRRHRTTRQPLNLTLRDPDFTGTVLDAYCMAEDGSVSGVDDPLKNR